MKTQPSQLTNFNNLKQIKNDLQQEITNLETTKNETEKKLAEIKDDDQKKPQLEGALSKAEAELKKKAVNLKYLDNINAAISASERNLHTIVKGRDQNFEQTDSLMKTQIANIESSARLSKDLHSSIPRLFATGGGASGTVLVGYISQQALGYTIPVEATAAAAAIVAGAFYGIYQWKVAPKNIERSQQEIVKNDYRRGIYFKQYVDRIVAALGALFDQTLNIYERVYGEEYDAKYHDEEEKQTLIWSILGGKEAICGKKCGKIYQHYAKNIIKPENWASCETGEGSKDCIYYRQ
jgi:hypothetical protein